MLGNWNEALRKHFEESRALDNAIYEAAEAAFPAEINALQEMENGELLSYYRERLTMTYSDRRMMVLRDQACDYIEDEILERMNRDEA